MTFLALLIALMLEQARAVQSNHPVQGWMATWVEWVRRHFDAGQAQHAVWAWGLAVLLPTVLSALVFWGLAFLASVLAWAWVVAVLYLVMGFRQFSHHFTEIRDALAQGDDDAARTELSRWLSIETHRLTRHRVIALAMQNGIVSAHRHVLGVIVCFVVLAVVGLGPAGAVFYRMAHLVRQRWVLPSVEGIETASVASLAARAWVWVDYVPVRVSAFCFAVVGHFEEALSRWRLPADGAPQSNDAVLLAAAGGALAVHWEASSHDLGPDGEPVVVTPLKVGHLASTVGLLWRSVVLWLGLLALLTFADW